MITRSLACALAALMAGQVPGAAQTPDTRAKQPDLSGSWVFKSWTHDGCDFGGNLHLGPTSEEGSYACELVANQVCPSVTWRVRQSCTARQSNGQLVINSQIEEFLEGEPSPNYWPDNFILTIRSREHMKGSLISHGVHASEFRRDAGGIS
ncbi:MAG: hypothetical protein GVY06_04880 [Alphaproteobacteria bacterium]|nr:hypothetical protein [Alphaproteobacteria bacterium]